MSLRLLVLSALVIGAATAAASDAEATAPPAAVPATTAGARAGDPIELAARTAAARAIEARAAGRAPIAEILDDLARGLRRNQVTIEQAAMIVAMSGEPQPRVGAPAASAGAFRADPVATAPRPAVTPDRATAVLDGDLPPPGDASAPPPPPAAAGDLVTTVLAVRKSEVGRPAKLMIDGGANRGVAEGQEFAIRRDGKVLVKARVDAVKDSMSVCSIVPGSWADEQSDVHEGDEAAALPR